MLLPVALAIAIRQITDPAKLAKPSQQQIEWQDCEMGMFLHFAPNTWQESEGDNLSTPLNKINPTQLDTDQWARTAKNMGAKYLVFVAKHVGGFCWWQTDTTDYSVKNTPWRGGKGDVMADVAKSCKKFGLKLGVYLSPADRYHHIDVGGKAGDAATQAQYQQVFRRQLTELLTKYGPIFEVWFDGSLVFDVSDILKKFDPNAIVFQGPSANIRWVGNEDGYAPDPAWDGAVYNPKTWGTLTAKDGNPDGDRWLPNEVDCRMRDSWFWNSRNANTVKPLSQLKDMYENSVGHGSVMIINNTPDTTGLIPAPDVARAKEFGQEIKRRYGVSIVYSQGTGEIVEAMPSSPSTIDAAITMEDISQGERIRTYVIEGLVVGVWKELAHGTAVGHKKIDKFDPIKVAKVRIRVTKSIGTPIIKRIAVYSTE